MKAVMARVALAGAASFLTVVLLEGLSSVVVFGRDFVGWRQRETPVERHSRYDPELGWVSEPHIAIPNLYGPGRALHTNARGFRGLAETSQTIPAGRRRVICSGDSFTLGWGVRDEEAWCALLADSSAGLEAVNMGQEAYGFDQAYLWFRRDGVHLEHQVHVFAYITHDFIRMQSPTFGRFGKPRLALRSDSLVVTDVPARQRGGRARFVDRTRFAARGLRIFELARQAASQLPSKLEADSPEKDSVTRDVAAIVVRELAAFHRDRGSHLILVHLPVSVDDSSQYSDVWRLWMERTAAREGVAFVDLVAALRTLPGDSVPGLFLPGNGHLTAAGNRWVAEQLRPRVMAAAGAPPAGRPR